MKVKERIVLSEIHLRTTGRHLSVGSHSVTCHPTEVTAPPSPQLGRLVLDLSTLYSCEDKRLSWPNKVSPRVIHCTGISNHICMKFLSCFHQYDIEILLIMWLGLNYVGNIKVKVSKLIWWLCSEHLTLKALRYESHCFACKEHHVCLYLVSVQQTAPPLTCDGIHLVAAYYSFVDLKGWKAEMAWLADLQQTVYPYKWSPSMLGWAEDRESSSIQRPTFYHCAMPPVWKCVCYTPCCPVQIEMLICTVAALYFLTSIKQIKMTWKCAHILIVRGTLQVVSGTHNFDWGLLRLLHTELHWLDNVAWCELCWKVKRVVPGRSWASHVQARHHGVQLPSRSSASVPCGLVPTSRRCRITATSLTRHLTAPGRTAPPTQRSWPTGFLCGWSISLEFLARQVAESDYWQEQFQTISEDISVHNILMHSVY